SLPELEPRNFSFNTPHGACPDCQGLGFRLEIDPDLLIPDKNLSLNEGAIAAMEWSEAREKNKYYWQMLAATAKAFHINLNKPIKDLSKDELNIILYGSGEEKIEMDLQGQTHRHIIATKWEGVVTNLMRRYRETNSDFIRSRISEYMNNSPCPTCGGNRLRAESLAVTVNDRNIMEVTEWPVERTLPWVESLMGKKSPLNKRDQVIADRILKEIQGRLIFLVNVGLDYLSLKRSAATLSGGEAQRIRLATQIGSRLMGVLYVLDEPSIGLHARDNARLLATLKELRDQGNTVIVVEHDEETIRSADWILDLGPGAGENGGEVVAEGPIDAIINNPASLTGAYLARRKVVPLPKKRRTGNGMHLEIIGAQANNLKNINVTIPLGKLVCITGVSGSGKSTLMVDILYQSLAHTLNHARTNPGKHKEIRGTEFLDKVININQSPIGRTPRSNPGTYTGVWDEVRKLFADLPESKMRGYKAGRFSFNVHGGRCEACQGNGQLKIEMQFLPDVYVPCDVCHGARFNRETLQVKFKGKTITDILNMTVSSGLEFFRNIPRIVRRLQTLSDVGLGYIHIGQSATTLSGGEAQRIKLSKELSRRATGKTLYVLDEPSVGLHAADVHKLVEVLQRLVDSGNSVLIIEHNLDIIKTADYIIDLGPEGGERGGQLIASGTPEEICKVKKSYTGQVLKEYIKGFYNK
ncbi:MAG: excinuclease ABC subunit UvrA, partial [Anaerolineaceae bacterium]|nr:excinuclease ABC subunit UvrA [Anaerolineaceae bacterium]